MGNTVTGFDKLVHLVGSGEIGVSGSAYTAVCNNVLYTGDNGIVDDDGGNSSKLLISHNAIGNTSVARLSGLQDVQILDDITLTADPFEDAGSDDYNLNDTAGGGALCVDLGASNLALL
jgi:hypothetical protein